MSEKRIRELAQQSVYESGLSGYIEEALDADPDVVAVLLWLEEWRDTYADKLTGNVYAPPDMAWATIEAAINEIGDMCHVRLTDDGWEWTDE